MRLGVTRRDLAETSSRIESSLSFLSQCQARSRASGYRPFVHPLYSLKTSRQLRPEGPKQKERPPQLSKEGGSQARPGRAITSGS